MERGRFGSPEDGKDKKKEEKRKKSVRFGVPVAEVDIAEPKRAEKPVEKSAGEAFIDELKKASSKERSEPVPEGTEKSDSKRVPTEIEAERPQTAETAESSDHAEVPAAETDDEKDYEVLPDQEIEPNKLSRGEVIIDLQGDEPVAERVIRLHDESPGKEMPPEQPEPSEISTPIFHRSEQSAPSRSETPAAAGGGELPPPPPPEEAPASVPEPPEPERSVPVIQPPAEILHRQQTEAEAGSTVLPNVAPAGSERPATKEDVEDALHRTAKARQQRGVLSGLFFGVLGANWRLRGRQKRQGKELGRQNKQLEKVTEQLQTVRQTQESQHISAGHRFDTLEKRAENPARPEKSTVGSAEKPAKPAAAREVEPTEQLEIPKNHHLETSAWHTIEVDSKTGKPAENPTFSYGHEYYREKAHEAAPKDQRNAAAGEVALVAAAMGSSGTAPGSDGSLPPVDIPLATTQGAPKSATAKPDAPAKQTPATSSTGPLWPWLVALVVVIICLIVAIH